MSYLALKGVEDYGDFTISDEIQYGLQTYFEWGLLSIGAFSNVTLTSSANQHILQPVTNANYGNIRVWEGFRNNWVWESGISYQVQPINISGVYVDGSFKPTGTTGAFAYNIDYINGRVIFDNAISSSSVVTCEYSYKRVKFVNSDSKEGRWLQSRTLAVNTDGEKKQLDRTKVQMPAVALELIPRSRLVRGCQLGGGQYLERSVLFHVYSETAAERNKIMDIITNQKESNIVIYDMNKLAENNMFPINLNGNIVNQSTRNYNNLVGINSQYGYRTGFFKDIQTQEENALGGDLFGGIAKVVLEIPIPNV